MRLLWLPATALALTFGACAAGKGTAVDYRTVPLAEEIKMEEGGEGPFTLTERTVVSVCSDNPAMMKNAELFADYIDKQTGISMGVAPERRGTGAIVLRDNLADSCSEAYSIRVCADSVVVNGASPAGVFYGLQTLRKSIAPGDYKGGKIELPAARIYDRPRFVYRGAHLDTSRHFFDPDSVKIFIDMLALHNVNRFHWHLTDDQGWRIEIKSHPELAEKGQWRSGTVVGPVRGGEQSDLNVYDNIPYGGYYTQDQVRDIVKYASDRHITVIPEIDMPGHMQAALHARPELGCTGGPYEVWRLWGVSEDVLCAGNDSVYSFIDDVLGEIVDLFPGEYVHIGGDECPKTRWEQCPKCQAKIKELGITADTHSTAEQKLQSYFMSHASDYLKRHGRKVIGWNEILEGGLPDDAVVMSWTGIDGAVKAARLGHDAILTPTDYCYFDYVQSNEPTEPLGARLGNPLTVEHVYSFDPAPAGLTPQQLGHVIGVQANLWCEYVPTMRHAQYMELPRLAAMSEVQWLQADSRDYPDFLTRLARLTALYDRLGYNYATHVLNR